jgi:hypothetical protein
LPLGGIKLTLSTALHAPSPTNPINVTLYGLPAPEGERGPIMPGFAGVLNDRQVAALMNYMRTTFTDKPAWSDVENVVARVRRGDNGTSIRPADALSAAPANATRRTSSW